MKTLLALTALTLTGCVVPYEGSYNSQSYQVAYQPGYQTYQTSYRACQPAYRTFEPAYVNQSVYQPSCGAYQQSNWGNGGGAIYSVPVQALPSRINNNCY